MNLNKLYKTFSIGIIIFINLLFAFKYFDRYTNHTILIIIPLAIFYFLLLGWKKINLLEKYGHLVTIVSIVGFILFSLLIFSKIPEESLKVDRWSVISAFWDNAFNGIYPYYAKSNMGNPPGPMPVYFILALPFYLINETGFLSIVGAILFILLLYKEKISGNVISRVTILIFSSIFYLWEVVSRSNIFFNSVIVLLAIIHFNRNLINNKKLYINAIISGLLMSTRTVLIIPYIVVVLSNLRQKKMNLGKQFVYGSIAVLSFGISFLPLLIIYPHDFLNMNPCIVQSSFLIPPLYAASFILVSIILSYMVKKTVDGYFYGGISLFISASIYFTYYIVKSGFHKAYIESEADISYFIFCIPFFLYYLVDFMEDKIKSIIA